MTKKLYYKDIDKSEFEAEIIETKKEKKDWRVILDKTCFFPEGGGQPADRGRINDIPVTDVQKEGDFIYHYLSKDPGQGMVKGEIDLTWRRDFMQQHTGQHIISGALWRVGKYKTLSVHMGSDYTTIEIDAPQIPAEDLIAVEKLANRVICENLPLSFIETTHRELDKFPMRKPTNRKGKIRLVQVGDFDCVACGGLHFGSTGKVGLVKAAGSEKIRGNARISWKIGDRAFADYREKDKICSALKTVLSTNEEMFVQKTTELQEEIINYKRKYNWLENRLAETIAQNLYNNRQEPAESKYRIITAAWQEENDILIKKIIKDLVNREKVLLCFVNTRSGKLQWSIGCSEDIHLPFNEMREELLPIIAGKGGGRPPLWQGVGENPQRAQDFLVRFRSLALNLP